MSKKYIITSINNIICGFLINDGRSEIIRAYEPESILGNIYVGRVSNIVQNINSAFVDIKKGLSCYMSLEDYSGPKLKIGDNIPVQLNKEAIKTKAPSVTTRLSLDGEYVVVTLNGKIGVSSKIKSESRREALKSIINESIDEFNKTKKSNNINIGIIVRTKAEDATAEIIKMETIKLLCKLDDIIYKSNYQTFYSCLFEKCPMIVKDICSYISDDVEIITDLKEVIEICNHHQVTNINYYCDDNVTLDVVYSLKSTINNALNKRVYLKSGAYIIIDHTEAMTVIDVNSGKAIKGTSKEEKVYAINLEAAKEIINQLILRDISGIIIIDFISMNQNANQNQLLKELKLLAELDKNNITIVDITRLGLVEITRKRVRKPLHEIF